MENRYREIKKEVRQKKELYINIVLCIVFMIICIPINLLLVNPTRLWSLMIASGWLVVIIIHYMAVFGIPFISKIGSKWEEKEVEKQMNQIHEDKFLDLNQPPQIKEKVKGYRDSDLV